MASKNRNIITLYYQNCRGLRSKTQALYMNVLSHSYDVIVLTETWLTPNITDNELLDDRYLIFRSDRDRVLTNKCDGGGTLIAVRRELRPVSVILPTACSAGLEHVIVALPAHKHNNKQHLISAVYIPPRTPEDLYTIHFNNLREIVLRTKIESFCALGDYNLPFIEWTTSETYKGSMVGIGGGNLGAQLQEFMAITNSLQYNHIRNKNEQILDLCITNQDLCSVLPCSDPLLPLDKHHPSLTVSIAVNNYFSPMKRRPLTKFKYRSANYDIINEDLDKIEWSILHDLGAEEAVQKFYEIIYKIIRNRIPTTHHKSSQYPDWFSPALIHIFKNKEKAWVKWKTYNNICDYELFSNYRARFKTECSSCYFRYIRLVEDSISVNSKYFWSYISKRKSTSSIPSSMFYRDKKANDPEQICSLFSAFFHSVFEPSTARPATWQPDTPTADNSVAIADIHIDLSSIKTALKTLDPTKGPGPDGLPVCFLRSTADALAYPLYILYNKCLAEGVFPSIWKHANITPVHKNGDKHDIENYRPISILSALSKMFESLVHNIIYPSIHGIIIPEQHGFVRRRSTTTNLMIFANYLFENMDRRLQIDAVYTDFKKCFDKVDHELLLQKISYNGIRGNLLRWFSSYISGRLQTVVVNGYKSETVNISSGVPQGSILGPLLFILYVNDIDRCFQNSHFLMYADDIKIYNVIKNDTDADLLQQDLNRFTKYCLDNKLHLSIPKCQSITFTKNRHTINFKYHLLDKDLKSVKIIKDLGVLFDSELHLDLHISTIKDKAFRMYGFIMRTACDFKRPSTFLHLFKSIVRPQLEYAIPVWNPIYQKYIDVLEKVQRKFLRCIDYRNCHARQSYAQLLGKYNLLSLEHRRTLISAMMLYNICNNRYDCLELCNNLCYVVPRTAHRREVRAGRVFHTPPSRTRAGERAPLRRLVDTFNKTFPDLDIFRYNPQTFKKLLIEHLNCLTK